MKVPRRTESGDAAAEQGEKRENTGSIRPMNNADRRIAAPLECSGTSTTGSEGLSARAGLALALYDGRARLDNLMKRDRA